jgi:hypothetical protein
MGLLLRTKIGNVTAEELDLSKDIDWDNKFNDNERHFIKTY